MPSVYYNDVPVKLEAAIKAVLDEAGIDPSVTINTGVSDQEMALPCVICSAETAGEEEVRDTGVFKIRARIAVKASPEDATSYAAYRSLIAQVNDAILNDVIASTLSSALTDFHCYDILRAGERIQVEDKVYTSELLLDAVCCGSDIT